MRVLIQRVREASVTIEDSIKDAIGQGLLVLVGIEEADEPEDARWLATKILQMRIFNDDKGLMNRSLLEIDGEILVISQFTLFAQTKKGNRPSFIRAAKPEKAIPLYEEFLQILQKGLGKRIGSGIFGADMQVGLVNDGPVTIFMDSHVKE